MPVESGNEMNIYLRVVVAFELFLVLSSAFSENEPLVGVWRAVDDSGTTSFIEIFMNNDQLHGRILNIFDESGSEINPVCERCKGVLKNKPVRGMTFIYGLKKENGKWVDGKVVDVRPGLFQGVTANCELELVGARAKIFGYLGVRYFSGLSFWDKVSPAESR